MNNNKIKLQSSLNAINAKATGGKRKALPKLKVILANPHQPPNDILSLIETCELREAMHFEVIMSGLNGRDYAKEHRIALGLHSSLRAITERRTSCVLVSETIKPKFIINQIVYFVKQKNFTVPVYVITNLGTLSESIYGTRALVIAFPLRLPISISEWIAKRTHQKLRPSETKKPKAILKKPQPQPQHQRFKDTFDLETLYIRSQQEARRLFVPPVVNNVKIRPAMEWSGDYISFSGTPECEEKHKQNERGDFETGKVKALRSMTDNVKPKESGYELRVRNEAQVLEDKLKKLPKIVYEENDDADFVEEHKKVKVHKIQRNPNRKQKKKKKMKEK